jgi:hypothetical protein
LVTASISAAGPVSQPDLPAGQRENLARRTDAQRALTHSRQRRRRNMRTVIGKMFIGLVADRHRVGAFRRARHAFQFGARQHAADGILRRVDQEGGGAVRHGGRQRHICQAPVRRRQHHAFHRQTGGFCDGTIGIIGRFDQHHLRAGPRHGEQRRDNRLGRAAGDDHLAVGMIGQPVMAGGVGGDGGAQFGLAAHWRILVRPPHQRPRRGLADRQRPVRIRKPLPQVDRPWAAASTDIWVKMVVGRPAKTGLSARDMEPTIGGPARATNRAPAAFFCIKCVHNGYLLCDQTCIAHGVCVSKPLFYLKYHRPKNRHKSC